MAIQLKDCIAIGVFSKIVITFSKKMIIFVLKVTKWQVVNAINK
jgi:hypothetical protein